MSDQERLAGYVDLWWRAVNDFTALLEELDPEDWSAPTDLPGWDVKACASHTAHLEGVLAGAPEETAEVGEAPHAASLASQYTEIGVVNRRDATPDAIINEIREAATARHTRLLADPPTDGRARPEPIFGGVPWDWETLLRNRVVDVWMHEQDVRRAVGRPGGMDSPAAVHTVDHLAQSLGYVLAKRVGAPPGPALLMEVAGPPPYAFVVNDSGRGERVADLGSAPTVRLRMDRESYVVLAGGRRQPAPGAVTVDGDADLGRRVLDGLAMTT